VFSRLNESSVNTRSPRVLLPSRNLTVRLRLRGVDVRRVQQRLESRGDELLKRLYRILASRRRRRAVRKIRRGFARAGYPLDKFRDSQIEAVLPHWVNDMSQVTVNAKTIYLTLKRLKVKVRFDRTSYDIAAAARAAAAMPSRQECLTASRRPHTSASFRCLHDPVCGSATRNCL